MQSFWYRACAYDFLLVILSLHVFHMCVHKFTVSSDVLRDQVFLTLRACVRQLQAHSLVSFLMMSSCIFRNKYLFTLDVWYFCIL